MHEGIETRRGPLIRIGAVKAHNAKQHGNPVVIHVQEEEFALLVGLSVQVAGAEGLEGEKNKTKRQSQSRGEENMDRGRRRVRTDRTNLAEYDQDGIDEFIEFGEVKDIHPKEERAFVDIFTTRVAEQVFNALVQTVELVVIDLGD